MHKFPDYGHSDPSFRENMIKEFPELKANGAKYVAFEGVPNDFKPQWLNDDPRDADAINAAAFGNRRRALRFWTLTANLRKVLLDNWRLCRKIVVCNLPVPPLASVRP
jgi:hypothetical protein